MIDLERIKYAAHRTANYYGASGTHEGTLLAEAFERFAEKLGEQIKEKEEAEERMNADLDDLQAEIAYSQDNTSGQ